MNFKSFAKTQPFLYRLWFQMNQSKLDSTVRLPNASDDYYFDGYPRSGNTFFQGLLGTAFSGISGASHLHTIAGIKLAEKARIKLIFIIFRNPKDAVISLVFGKLIFNNKGLNDDRYNMLFLENELREWISFYTYVLVHHKNIQLLSFEEIRSDNLLYIKKLENVFGKQVADSSALIERYSRNMRELEKTKDVSFSALPNEDRKKFKEEYSLKIQNLPSYSNAVSLYNELLRLTENLKDDERSKGLYN